MIQQKNIITRYKHKEFQKIPKGRLMDFIAGIPDTAIDKDLEGQEKPIRREIERLTADLAKIVKAKSGPGQILETWKAHFRSQKIPFVVTLVDGMKSLWKERRV